jgi:hypothetical protein
MLGSTVPSYLPDAISHLTAEHLRQLKQLFDTLLDKIIEIKHFSHFATETPLLSTFQDSSLHLKLGFEREVEVQVLRAKVPSPKNSTLMIYFVQQFHYLTMTQNKCYL